MAKLSDIEKELGILAKDRKKYPADQTITKDGLNTLFIENTNDFAGVDHEKRIKFLQDNGYELTHENMLNSNLPTVVKPKK